MGATLTTISAVAKELYEGSLNKQLNDETVTLKRVERSSEGVSSQVGAKYVNFPIHTRRNAGVGARREMEALPTAGNQSTAGCQVGLRYLYGSIRMSGQTLKLAKTNTQAFISALELEMNGMKSDLAVDFNRQIYGNGTGALCIATTAVGGGGGNTVTCAAGTQWVQLGMKVDLYDATGATATWTNRTVTTITDTVVTIDGAAFVVVLGDFLVRTGSVGETDGDPQRELTGLGKMVASSGALYGVTDSVWTSVIDTNSGTNRALSEGLMIKMADDIRKRGGKTTAIFSNLGVRRSYFNLLVQQRRVTNTQKFEGGFSGLAFSTDDGDVPVVVDTQAKLNSQYFLNEKEIKLFQESDWSFMDHDGSMWDRVTGYDAYDATLVKYAEIATHRRNSQGEIQDITEG
jgi:hypothetical protein